MILTKNKENCVKKLDTLNLEKVIFQKELKRYRDEQNCRFANRNKRKTSFEWPCLNDRY